MVHIRDATAADADALAPVMIDPIVTAFQGIVPDQCLDWTTYEESAANWRRALREGLDDGGCLLVAEDGTGAVVAFALAGVTDEDPIYQTELKVIAASPTYQRQGIGRLLVHRVVEHLKRWDAHSLLVRVISTNPHTAFYERLGGEYRRDEPYEWNGGMLAEVVYGWADTAPLTAT